MITVSRKKLVNFMINDDIDGLAEYIEDLVNNAYDIGWSDGVNEDIIKPNSTDKKYELMDREYNI